MEGKSVASHSKVSLSISNRMSMERTMMAAERTLLAWVRTAMAFISFGFTMYKLLETTAVVLASKIDVLQPAHIGILLMVVGTVPLGVGMYQFYQFSRKYGKTVGKSVLNASFLLASVILLLGIVLFLDIVLQWHLL
ncbi:MAG TPA: DUF202 domain-containing protein [Negativicutes bacterium]|nr:DUF202 domain-containing protein [Negativicutes bacterium]